MAKSLVSGLSNLPGVTVRSVGSVRRFRGAEQDPIDAARELNVTWIVDGAVQRADGRVRVSARLLNTTSGEAAWSGSFDEDDAGVGWNRFWHDWDWDGAKTSFERALALNASESNAHFGYSQLLEMQRRSAQALDHLRQARESDPLSLILLTLESGSLIGAGRAVEARQRLQRAFDIAPDFWVAHMAQSIFQNMEGKTEDSLESLARADRLADGSSQAAAALGNALARKGYPERAQLVLQRLLDLAKTRYVPPTSTGLIYAGLGNKAAALAALEAGFAVRDVRMTLVWNDRRWQLLKDDPRYAALRAAMRLG